ncbi:MAG: hypothetical protein ACO3PY_05755 [Pontimonas sp.]
MSDYNHIDEYLSTAVAGSLVGQIARARNISFKEMFAADGVSISPTIRAITLELDELGIDPELIASQVLYALVALFAKEENAELITSQYTSLLWSILGDPKNGGSPPEIYRRAGCALHLTLLGILDPSIPEQGIKL